MNSTLAIISSVVLLAFGASAIGFSTERTAPRFLQLLGATLLMVVVFSHIAEAFRLLPWMGWGVHNSAGHDLDLISAVGGSVLFPLGYLSRAISKRRTST